MVVFGKIGFLQPRPMPPVDLEYHVWHHSCLRGVLEEIWAELKALMKASELS
jgi:hypothetical protein